MKSWLKKAIALFLCFITVFSFTSCAIDDLANDIADKVVGEFDTSKNDPVPTGKPGVNEQILYETVLLEDLLKEDIITEDILEEQVITEIVNYEPLQSEDIYIESVTVEIYDDVDELEDDFCCESYYSVDLDYSFIKQRIAQGMSIVLTEVIIDTVSAIINLVTLQWGSLAVDLGQIVFMAGGTTLSAFVAGQVAKAKSLAAGNSYEMAMYDALYEGSNAFYYTAVSIDTINTIISIGQLASAGVTLVKKLVDFITSKPFRELVDASGRTIGKVTSKGAYKVTIDGVTSTCRATPNLSGTVDLYDTASLTYVATLKQSGDTLVATKRAIPGEILLKSGANAGNPKYIFSGTDAYKVTYAQNGNAVKTWMGTVDQGGFIKNNFGQIVNKIDFDTGKEVGGFTKLIKAGGDSKITVTPFGDLVEITDVAKQSTKPLVKKTVDGAVTYLDSANNKILYEYAGTDGIAYLMRSSDNVNYAKVSGALSDGRFDMNWKVKLNYVRSNATSTVRSKLVDFVKDNNINIVRQNFPELSLEAIDYIKQYGRIPTNIQIHHCKNVANYPDLAGDFSNLVVLTRDSHLAEHFGNFHNATIAKPSVYVDLKVLFDL